MDITLPWPVLVPCGIPHIHQIRLHLQHGSECRCGSHHERDVDVVLGVEVQKSRKTVGCLAWVDCLLDHLRHEFGALRLSAVVGHGGCACPVALGHSYTDGVVVQVSRLAAVSMRSVLTLNHSFLLKDASEDLQAERLKQ